MSQPTAASPIPNRGERQVAVGPRRFHVIEEGAGDAIVMIGGFTCDTTVFDALAPLLARDHRVIRFDNRGIGQTMPRDQGDDYADLTVGGMAADTSELLRTLGIGRAHVLGHSMGGQIAQELAIRAPDQVRSLILLSSWAKPDKRLAWLIDLFADLAERLPPADFTRSVLPWMFTSDLFAAAPAMMEGAVQQWQANAARPTSRLLRAQARAINASDTSERLHLVKAPTLVGVASSDQLTPVHLSQALAQGIAGAKLFAAKQGAHAFVLDAAEEIADHIGPFLRTT